MYIAVLLFKSGGLRELVRASRVRRSFLTVFLQETRRVCRDVYLYVDTGASFIELREK